MKVPRTRIEEVEQEYLALPYSKRRCVSCGSLLPEEIRDAWENDMNYAWLYSQCLKCGYQNALWKVFRRAGINYPKEMER